MLNHHVESPDCLLCAVRDLTEGEPKKWVPKEPGDMVSGVVMRLGTFTGIGPDPVYPDQHPYVDLWIGGRERVRVRAHSAVLAQQIRDSEAAVGDRMTVNYEGKHQISSGRYEGRSYNAFTVTVERGHH